MANAMSMVLLRRTGLTKPFGVTEWLYRILKLRPRPLGFKYRAKNGFRNECISLTAI